MRNSVFIDLPIIVDVVAGIRCIDGDPQCPYDDRIGFGAHELGALVVALEDIRNRSEWANFHDMKIRISDSNGVELNSIEYVAGVSYRRVMRVSVWYYPSF